MLQSIHNCCSLPPCPQAWWRTQLAQPTGSPIRTSTPVTSASASSPHVFPSTTAAPVARGCATTALRSGEPCRPAAGTTPWGSATAATRKLGSSSIKRSLSQKGSWPWWKLDLTTLGLKGFHFLLSFLGCHKTLCGRLFISAALTLRTSLDATSL